VSVGDYDPHSEAEAESIINHWIVDDLEHRVVDSGGKDTRYLYTSTSVPYLTSFLFISSGAMCGKVPICIVKWAEPSVIPVKSLRKRSSLVTQISEGVLIHWRLS